MFCFNIQHGLFRFSVPLNYFAINFLQKRKRVFRIMKQIMHKTETIKRKKYALYFNTFPGDEISMKF